MNIRLVIAIIAVLTFSLTGKYLNHGKNSFIDTEKVVEISGQCITYSGSDTISKYSLLKDDDKDFIGNYRDEELRIIKYIKDFKRYKFKLFGAEKFAKSILYVHDKYDIDIDILLALIKYESGFRPSIVQDRTGCIGACQINFKVWGKTLISEGLIDTKEDLFDITSNVICGAYILDHYMEKHGTIEIALQRYYGKCNYASIYSDNVLGG